MHFYSLCHCTETVLRDPLSCETFSLRTIEGSHLNKIVNNPPYKDRRRTTNQNGEVKTITTQRFKVIEIVYQKYKDIRKRMLCSADLEAISSPGAKGTSD